MEEDKRFRRVCLNMPASHSALTFGAAHKRGAASSGGRTSAAINTADTAIDGLCRCDRIARMILTSLVLSMRGRRPQRCPAGVTKRPGGVALADFAGEYDL